MLSEESVSVCAVLSKCKHLVFFFSYSINILFSFFINSKLRSLKNDGVIFFMMYTKQVLNTTQRYFQQDADKNILCIQNSEMCFSYFSIEVKNLPSERNKLHTNQSPP